MVFGFDFADAETEVFAVLAEVFEAVFFVLRFGDSVFITDFFSAGFFAGAFF